MKRLLYTSAILSVLFFGCSNPIENSPDPIKTESTILQKSYDHGTNDPLTLPNELYVEKAIDGSDGGSIQLQGQFVNAYGDIVTVDTKLTIPSNSFFGIKVISIRTDSYSPVLTFEPNSYFNNPLSLNLKFTGIHLERYALQDGKTDFVCILPDETIEVVKADGLSIDIVKNKAEVLGAKLKHFSRYGFIRKTGQSKNKLRREE